MDVPSHCPYCGSRIASGYLLGLIEYPEYECGTLYQGARKSACYTIEGLKKDLQHCKDKIGKLARGEACFVTIDEFGGIGAI